MRVLAVYSLSIPNEDFGRRNKRCHPDFEGSTFQGREHSILGYEPLKSQSKSGCHRVGIKVINDYNKPCTAVATENPKAKSRC